MLVPKNVIGLEIAMTAEPSLDVWRVVDHRNGLHDAPDLIGKPEDCVEVLRRRFGNFRLPV